jgi:hypothetical protein
LPFELYLKELPSVAPLQTSYFRVICQYQRQLIFTNCINLSHLPRKNGRAVFMFDSYTRGECMSPLLERDYANSLSYNRLDCGLIHCDTHGDDDDEVMKQMTA